MFCNLRSLGRVSEIRACYPAVSIFKASTFDVDFHNNSYFFSAYTSLTIAYIKFWTNGTFYKTQKIDECKMLLLTLIFFLGGEGGGASEAHPILYCILFKIMCSLTSNFVTSPKISSTLSGPHELLQSEVIGEVQKRTFCISLKIMKSTYRQVLSKK